MVHADELINAAIAEAKCPGAVLLVGRGNQVLYEKAYGNRAVRPTTQPMTTDTVFDVASLTKPIATATSVMILNSRGKLKLDDPVAKYLPTFGQGGKEKIRISDLLLHIGGLIPDDDLSDYGQGPTIAMEKILVEPPSCPPGSQFAYSDVGYIVLGELVHQVNGRSLDVFASEEIFRPLGMNSTGFLPPDSLKARCAPTQQRDGKWLVGEVHDPRAHALGNVGGHAGLFSTAEDISKYCRMLLSNGEVSPSHNQILNASAVEEMLLPRLVPLHPSGTGLRAYGFDMDTPYSSPRGDRFELGATLGHTGFTGTAFWIDPAHKCYYILLTNSVHPDGKGNVKKLRHDVATVVAEALLGPPLSSSQGGMPLLPATAVQKQVAGIACHLNTLVGIDILHRENFKSLDGRKIALITNQTGRDREGNRTVDLFAAAKNLKLVKLFSPEHGIDGVLDEKISTSTDAKTGLTIFSLYNDAKSHKPTPEMLAGIDTLVFDIQDVGTRFYTYITTMGLCMQAAAENKIRFVVLDRPNPNTGLVVDGPLADRAHIGFTAFGPLPLVHGMTVAEVALFYNTEFSIHCDLQIIAMESWRRNMWWDDTGLMWVNPSPNLRNPTAALLYPAVGLLEATNISVGRGTDQPFEQFGAPWIDGRKLAAALNNANLPGLRFVPTTFEPSASKFAKEKCQGAYIEVTDRNAYEPATAGMAIAWQLKNLFSDKFQSAMVEKMLQNTEAAKSLLAVTSPVDYAAWKREFKLFREVRQKYLVYP